MSKFGEIWRRVGMLVRRGRFARELDEEMRLHRELKERELAARGVGTTTHGAKGETTGEVDGDDARSEARYAAARAFGNVTALNERGRAAWGWRWLEDFLLDLRFGARMLRKNPGFTAVAVLTIALGIGANGAIFGLVDSALLRGLPFREPERLVHIWTIEADGDLHTPTPTEYLAVRGDSQSPSAHERSAFAARSELLAAKSRG